MIDEENQLDTTPTPLTNSDGVAGEVSSEPQADLPPTEAEVVVEVDAGVASEPSAEHQAALTELENELKAVKAQLDDRTNQLVRTAADFDNYRKRTQREREEQEQQIKCSTINELLPVVDNFERARSQIKPQTDAEATIHKSYQSVYKQLVDCLKRVGVAPMRAEGKEFDPNLHEAVLRQATSEHPEGTVIEELQRGYLLGERVLRHALVKVAAPPEPDSAVEQLDPSAPVG
ncbi:MAG TPA: nucleotide exchange factor GrpE [Thermosynechococcaceae cyanobacterium]